MIMYDKLWETLESKGVSQYKLINTYHFSGGQLSRMKKNMHVSTRTIERLCTILDCGMDEIVEITPDEKEE